MSNGDAIEFLKPWEMADSKKFADKIKELERQGKELLRKGLCLATLIFFIENMRNGYPVE